MYMHMQICVVIGLSVMMLSTTSIIQSEMNSSEGLGNKVEMLQPAPAVIDDVKGDVDIVPDVKDKIIKPWVKDDQVIKPEIKGNRIIKPGIEDDQVIKPAVKEKVNYVDKGAPPDQIVAANHEDRNNIRGGGGQLGHGQDREQIKKPIQVSPPSLQRPPNHERQDQRVNPPEDLNLVKGNPPEDLNPVKGNPPAPSPLAQPEVKAAPAHERVAEERNSVRVEKNEENGDKHVHNVLQNDVSKLSARLNQLEEENKNLKQRQEAIEQIQVEDLLRDGVIVEEKRVGEENRNGPAEKRESLKDTAKVGGGSQIHADGRRITLGIGGVDHEVQHRDSVEDQQEDNVPRVLDESSRKDQGHARPDDDNVTQDSLHVVDGERISKEKSPTGKNLRTGGHNNNRLKGGQRDLKTILAL